MLAENNIEGCYFRCYEEDQINNFKVPEMQNTLRDNGYDFDRTTDDEDMEKTEVFMIDELKKAITMNQPVGAAVTVKRTGC